MGGVVRRMKSSRGQFRHENSAQIKLLSYITSSATSWRRRLEASVVVVKSANTLSHFYRYAPLFSPFFCLRATPAAAAAVCNA